MRAVVPLEGERRRDDREREPTPRLDREPSLTPAQDRVLALQHSAGNAAVAGALLQRTEAGVAARPPAPGPPDEYRVELKGWIPHRRVPDPELPLRMAANNPFRTVTHSEFYGDGHTAFAGGTHRARSFATFKWDGSTITDWAQAGDTSGTFRYETFAGLAGSGVDTFSGAAPGSWTGSPVGATGFELGYEAADPLSIMPAPDMDGKVEGTFSGGNLDLTVTTDAFPSHGLQVKRNGSVISEFTAFDASGISLGNFLTAGPILLVGLNTTATPVTTSLPDPRFAPPAGGGGP